MIKSATLKIHVPDVEGGLNGSPQIIHKNRAKQHTEYLKQVERS